VGRSIAGGAELGGGRCWRGGDPLLRGRDVFGESFQVDRGASEQELDVEGGRATAPHAR
jgi:hypothetical protein